MEISRPDRAFPGQRVWNRPSQVPAGSGLAEQVDSMRRLVDGQVTASEFAKSWLGARGKALAGGERVREPFGRVLLDVFYLLEDYAIDPTLRDEDDMSDAELTERVREALQRLDAL